MFLLIVGHNVRIRIIANHFQHSIETLTWHFKEVRCALCRLGKILIHPSNMVNEVLSYVGSNLKYFPWFKVTFYKKYIYIYNVNFMYINSFHDHYFNSLIIMNVCCYRTTSVQLMVLISVHGSQLIEKPVLRVEKQL